MATSLGRQTGTTLIGRPLDFSFQAVLDAQDDVGGLCLDADVFYGDNRLAKSSVRVTLEKSTSASGAAIIRVRSATLVDEPIVTLNLRVGCQQKTERRYVTLAELVPDTTPDRNALAATPAPLRSSAQAAPLRPAASPLDTAAASAQASLPQTSRPAKPKRPAKADSAMRGDAGGSARNSASGSNPLPALVPPKSSRSEANSKSRLKLEPFDLSVVRDPELKASTDLLSIPSADPKERAAASALWRALSAQPQDILRDTEKLEALEKSILSLQAQSQKTLSSIDQLNVKLEQTRTERYANMLVYALVALLLAAIAGLAYLLRNRVSGQGVPASNKPWWRKNDAYENQQEAWLDSSPPMALDEPGDNQRLRASKPAAVDIDVEFDLDQINPKPVASLPVASSNFAESVFHSSKSTSDFGPSLMHPARAMKAEELFDVQQQADFFVSIGQPEQAIDVLRTHIAENPETSALVYLDLFNLYHQLKRPAEYDGLRGTFNQRFNARIPTFEMYPDKKSGLESYQLALSRIQALWPSQKVLEIIEESLFRQPDSTTEAFSLEAYRDLLLLYSVAKEIIEAEPDAVLASKRFVLPDLPVKDADSRSANFMATAIQPLSASMDTSRWTRQPKAVEDLMSSVVPPASARLGLDIDLSEFSGLGETSNFETSSDAEFFAQFDPVETVILQPSESKPPEPVKGNNDIDNLIEFFDVDVDASLDKSTKPGPTGI